ncbi:MAG TPA: hypothetical protein VKJ47_00575 [Candidatus Binatia bacterium]|nr:hypothetical protein [Candidatus Binatia bacterium]
MPIENQLDRPSVAQAEDKSLLGRPFESLAGEQEEPFHGLIIDRDMDPGFCFGLYAQTVWCPARRFLRKGKRVNHGWRDWRRRSDGRLSSGCNSH